MTFEEALAELEVIVRQLEEGKGRLDQAIDAYSRGAQLKRHCEAKLAEAQARVDRIVLGPDGAITTQPTDIG
jgi:exodeoxyribonuclease VII small subunit